MQNIANINMQFVYIYKKSGLVILFDTAYNLLE